MPADPRTAIEPVTPEATTMNDLLDDLAQLTSAEEFFDYFALGYDERVLRVNRLHILQRFHDYIAAGAPPPGEAARHALYRDRLARAYADFVGSDARKEAVFAVFRKQAGLARVPLTAIGRGVGR
jgi:nitrogenase-stabilizing/protective protein